MLKGIDVSKHNEVIDWNKVKNQIDFAILRVGYGDNISSQDDQQFERNYAECKRLSIPVGVYLYSYATNEAHLNSEIEHCKRLLQGKSLELPIFFDIEDKSMSILSKDILTNFCFKFCEAFEQLGFWSGVYTYKSFMNSYLDKGKLQDRFTIWIAQYAGNCDYQGKYAIWQYADNGNIEGISGKVDMNIMYDDLISKISCNNVNNSKKSIDEVAKDVLNGVYGNGIDRKRNIEAEGYNYSEVQNKVNQMFNMNSYYPACNSRYFSLVDALNSLKINSSFTNRVKISQKNNVHDYSGTSIQNRQLLDKLKAGKLIK